MQCQTSFQNTLVAELWLVTFVLLPSVGKNANIETEIFNRSGPRDTDLFKKIQTNRPAKKEVATEIGLPAHLPLSSFFTENIFLEEFPKSVNLQEQNRRLF